MKGKFFHKILFEITADAPNRHRQNSTENKTQAANNVNK